MTLVTGDILRNRYKIVRAIKSGGMGSVFEAADKTLADRPCAVKEVLENAIQGPDSAYVKAAFEAEMKALSSLDHPCIPKVRDFFQEGERLYIVMDLVHGQSLDAEVRDHVELSGRGLPPGKAVGDILQLLEIVAYLHSLTPPFLHRDIKPSNILRDEKSGRIKLVDFGLAKPLQNTQTPQTMVGTLGYCAPEQLAGSPELGSDVYSVGATLYHLVMGKAPVISYDPLEIEGCDPVLTGLVAGATQPLIAERIASAADFAEALRLWRANLNTPITDPQTFPQPTPEEEHNQWPWAAIVVLALGLGLGGGYLHSRPSPVDAAPATATATPIQEETFGNGFRRTFARDRVIYTKGNERVECFSRQAANPLKGPGPDDPREVARLLNSGNMAEDWKLDRTAEPFALQGMRVVPMRGPNLRGGYLIGVKYLFKYTTTGALNSADVVSLFRDPAFVGQPAAHFERLLPK